MTFREFLSNKLYENGMPKRIAQLITEELAKDADLDMADIMDMDTSGFPPVMQGVAWGSAKAKALVWIDANAPNAWYRPAFTGRYIEQDETKDESDAQ